MKKYSFFLAMFLAFIGYYAVNGQTSYSNNYKPESIILLLANGMGTSALNASVMESKAPLNLTKFNFSGLVKSSFHNNTFPDEAAIMTAVACGIETNNGTLGIDTNKIPVDNLFKIARACRKYAGIITTAAVTDPVPASFYAHQTNLNHRSDIIKNLIEASPEVFIGGGRKYFKDREDKKPFYDQLNMKEYKILEDNKELKSKSHKKIAGLIDDENIKSIKGGRGEFFELAWLRAFKTLVRNDTGYFLVIDNAHINWACTANDNDYLVSEILDFDKLIGEIMKLVSPDNKTLVIVLSCFETGGLAITQSSIDKKMNYKWSSKNRTLNLTPVFANGPGAENFSGMMGITEIFTKLKKLIE
jgi:alkaline phosphatase